MDRDQLRDWFTARNAKPFRADQLIGWVFDKHVIEPAQMTNLGPKDRELLEDMTFLSGDAISHQVASDGTQKLLVQWHDHDGATPNENPLAILNNAENDPARQTECVMIPSLDDDQKRKTACISSQVGCPVGCRFCASGLGGLDGNLSTGRIVEQVWRLAQLPGVGRITNVVFMGMGEPLANFQPVLGAVRSLARPTDQAGLGISARKITISTVGLPGAIHKLADQLDLPVTLALSLHAPNDELRRALIPWAQYTTIPELADACQHWFNKTGREITLEYILLGGVNDSRAHARELVKVAGLLRANVNLIRYNEVDGLEYSRPRDEDVRGFQETLLAANVNTHIRASRGRDIAAACGQLRHESAV